MPDLIRPTIDLDVAAIAQGGYDLVQSQAPGWSPDQTEFGTLILNAGAQMSVDLRRILAAEFDPLTEWIARTMLGIDRESAAYATSTLTFTLLTAAPTGGYTIPGNTEVGLVGTGGSLWSFFTIADLLIPAGSTSGSTIAIANDPGADYNVRGGVYGATQISASPNGVASIAATLSSSGADEEDSISYLNRVARRVRILGFHPVMESDFALLAQEIPGVWRALAVDGYDAVADTYNNANTISVFPQDAAGQPVSSAIKTALAALFDNTRGINFNVIIADPVYTNLTIVTTVAKQPGANATQVHDDVQNAIFAYLNPAAWGTGTQVDPPWVSTPVFYYNALWGVIDRVYGVDHVTSLTVNGGTTSTLIIARPQGLFQLAAPATVTVT